ncbi:MAG TPA: DUF502 domain-containing protein [Bacteroidia bacterium]|jgi:uncharacterized membrane protein|nr:DUF502 domain-containing protein [Bacteroidia bacterium]
MKAFLRYFIQGLILFIPLIITLAVLVKLFDFFEGVFAFIGFSQNTLLNTVLGLLVTVSFVTVLGLLASSFVFQQLFSFLEDKLEHAPFIRHIYSPLKDFTNAFMGNKKRFNKPVLVLTNPAANIEEIGFVTNEDLSYLNIKDRVAVYLPMSYSLSGRMLIIPSGQVRSLDADAAEVMKFTVSGGVSDVD